MSETPLIDIFRAAIVSPYYWQHITGHHALHAYLAPGDAYDIAREAANHDQLRHTAFRSAGPMVEEWAQNLFGIMVSVQSRVAEGWMVLENGTAPKGLTISMHRMRCIDHEECRSIVEMARLCEADHARARLKPPVHESILPPGFVPPRRGW